MMTNAELALLGLIVEKPRHGYEIEQVIEQRGMRDWTEIGFSSIYYLLKKLEGKGYTQGQRQSSEGAGPDRKTYHATEAGQKAWNQASLDCLREPNRSSGSLLLGLSALPALDQNDAISALNQYLDRLQQRKSHMNARSDAQQPLPPHVDAMFDYSRAIIQREMEWIEKLIQDLETGRFLTGRSSA